MRRIVAFALGLLLAALTPPSWADLVMKSSDGAAELRLYESTCTHAGTIGHIKARFPAALPEHVAKFRNARILDKRGTIESYGCWLESDDGRMFVIFEDGTSTEQPTSRFSDPLI